MKEVCIECGRKSKTIYCSWECEHPLKAKEEEPKVAKLTAPPMRRGGKDIRKCICGGNLLEDEFRYCSDKCRERVRKTNEVTH